MRVSSDSPRPCVTSTPCLQGSWWSIPVDTGCYVTERIWNVAVNPKKTKLGLPEVEYVGHLVSALDTSFTPEKRSKVLDFPQPTTQKEMLQFIGLANYFRDYVPNMTEMAKLLRDMIPLGKYQRTGKLIWTTESSAAFELCQQAISKCQEL